MEHTLADAMASAALPAIVVPPHGKECQSQPGDEHDMCVSERPVSDVLQGESESTRANIYAKVAFELAKQAVRRAVSEVPAIPSTAKVVAKASSFDKRFRFEHGMPARLTKIDDSEDWPSALASCRTEVLELLAQSGAMTLRGARRPPPTAEDQDDKTVRLQAVSASLLRLAGREVGAVQGGSLRTRTGDVNSPKGFWQKAEDESEETTAEERFRTVVWHQELGFFPDEMVPHALALCCVELPDSGGWTYLTRSDDLWAASSDALKAQLAGSTHIVSTRTVRSEGQPELTPTWQDLFASADGPLRSEDRKYVEGVCDTRGWEYEWLDSGALDLTIKHSLTRTHPLTGETCWSNALNFVSRPFNKKTTELPGGRVLSKPKLAKELVEAYANSNPFEFAWTKDT